MSGKKIKAARKVAKKTQLAKNLRAALAPLGPKLELDTPVTTLKLDLACGQNPREGFEGVDIYPGAKHVMNVLTFPWPWDTSSVDEIHCSHFLEHIPMIYVNEFGTEVPCGSSWPNPKTGVQEPAQDLLFRFMDEVYRVLKPGGIMTIIVPNARHNRAFQDPTHRRFFVAETFFYFFKAFRDMNKLDHYNVKSNFGSVGEPGVPDVVPIIPIEYNALAPEVQMRRFGSEWNIINDWQARLKAIKE